MSLEIEIARLTTAVEALTAKISGATGLTYVEADLGQSQPEPKVAKVAKPKPKPTPEPEVVAPKATEAELLGEPATKHTLQDIRSLAQAALDGGKLAGVVAINKEFGLKRISEATEDKFPELVARLTSLVNG